jgi:hypothetical protein
VLRRVLQVDANVCVGGCGSLETTNHLFLGCSFFGELWLLVWKWLCISSVNDVVLRHHFVQFGQLAGLPRSSHSFLKLIWLAFGLFERKEINKFF